MDWQDADAGWSWYTFVREPTARSFSQYLQDIQLGAVDASTTFQTWAEMETLGARNRNAQTKQLAGTEDVDEAIRRIQTKNMFVGITEKFDESLRLWSLIQDTQSLPLRYGVAKNVRGSKNLRQEFAEREPQLEPELLAHNDQDLKLYEYVCNDLWPAQMRSVGGDAAVAAVPWNAAQGVLPKMRKLANRAFRNVIYKPYCRSTMRSTADHAT